MKQFQLLHNFTTNHYHFNCTTSYFCGSGLLIILPLDLQLFHDTQVFNFAQVTNIFKRNIKQFQLLHTFTTNPYMLIQNVQPLNSPTRC